MPGTPHSKPESKLDAIVVGAGLGGLSAAAYLAAAGKRVLLLERYTTLGGSSHVFGRRGQWEFDCGVHYIGEAGPGGTVSAMMRGLGLEDHIEWLPLDENGFDRIIAPDFELATPFGWDAYLDSLLTSFPEEQRAVRRFHAIMRRLADAHDRNDMGTVGGMARWAKRSSWATAYLAVPYARTLRICGLSPRAALALSVQCGALASSPSVIPTAAMAAFFAHYVGGGAYYPRGGGQMLAAGFASVITAHGGTIRTNAEVVRIELQDGRVTGVRLAGGELVRASAVVSDADIIRTYTELVGLEHLPTLFAKRVARWRMSQPLINGFFGVQQDLTSRPNSNFFAIPTWGDATSHRATTADSEAIMSGDGFATSIDWAKATAARHPMFVQSSSRRDPRNHRAAPAGSSTVEVQTVTPADPRLWGISAREISSRDYRRNSEYLEVKKIILDGMLDRMEQAYPGSSSSVVTAELGTPATQSRFVGNTGGAPFGLQLRLTQSGPMRPKDTTPIPGLYTVGTSTVWGPGTAGAMLSGVNAAGTITGRDLVAAVHQGERIGSAELPAWGADFDPFAITRALHGS